MAMADMRWEEAEWFRCRGEDREEGKELILRLFFPSFREGEWECERCEGREAGEGE